jgi:hypothetical protein
MIFLFQQLQNSTKLYPSKFGCFKCRIITKRTKKNGIIQALEEEVEAAVRDYKSCIVLNLN